MLTVARRIVGLLAACIALTALTSEPAETPYHRLRVIFERQQYGPSFDCRLALSFVQRSICDDAELSKLDLRLSDALGLKFLLRSTIAVETMKAREAWLVSRNHCGDISCLRRMYERRLETVSPQSMRPTTHYIRPGFTRVANSTLSRELAQLVGHSCMRTFPIDLGDGSGSTFGVSCSHDHIMEGETAYVFHREGRRYRNVLQMPVTFLGQEGPFGTMQRHRSHGLQRIALFTHFQTENTYFDYDGNVYRPIARIGLLEFSTPMYGDHALVTFTDLTPRHTCKTHLIRRSIDTGRPKVDRSSA